MSDKSDVTAKKLFVEHLKEQGFIAEIKSRPVDIIATKNGETWYFEIKKTRKDDLYFGAATMTEWEQAFKTPDTFRFVVAIEKSDGSFIWKCYTPEEFLRFSTIPPFKIFFRINFKNEKKNSKRRTSIPFTKMRYNLLQELYTTLEQIK